MSAYSNVETYYFIIYFEFTNMVGGPRIGRLDLFPSTKGNNQRKNMFYIVSGCWDAMGARSIDAVIVMPH